MAARSRRGATLTNVILILGGTREGRELGQALDRLGVAHVVSLAGRTTDPLAPRSVRVGGFGGPEGLAEYLAEHQVTTVVDATHPFAATMTENAAAACGELGVRLIRVDRPGWQDHPDADAWHWVTDHGEAAATVASLGERRVLLTVGRQHSLAYAPVLGRHAVVARAAEPPDGPLPAPWRLVLARGPFGLDDERRLFAEHGIDCLVTKDAGGSATEAKLTVAREVGAAVVIIRRPPLPGGMEVVPDVAAALALLSP